MTHFFKKHAPWLLPAIFLLVIAPFTPTWDLQVSNFFYRDGKFTANRIIEWFYSYGFIPTDVIAGIALLVLVGSLFYSGFRKFQAPAAMLVFTLVIGSGLFVHLVFKDHWGRPRPRQVIEFGRHAPFQPFYVPKFDQKFEAKSFPCGHCSVGFYYLVLILIGLRHKKKWLIYLGIATTLFFGLGLSYARLAQGGHFLSDVIVSALIMWWTAFFLDWLIYGKLSYKEEVL